jgi:hypothetical protein
LQITCRDAAEITPEAFNNRLEAFTGVVTQDGERVAHLTEWFHQKKDGSQEIKNRLPG